MRRSIDRAYCKVVRATDQTIANIAFTAVSWSSVAAARGSDVSWDSGSPTRLTISRAGWYALSGYVIFPNAAGTTRIIGLLKNSANYLALDSRPPVTSGNTAYMAIAAEELLAAGDYVETTVYQDCGISLALSASTGAPTMRATRLGS